MSFSTHADTELFLKALNTCTNILLLKSFTYVPLRRQACSCAHKLNPCLSVSDTLYDVTNIDHDKKSHLILSCFLHSVDEAEFNM